MKRQPVVNWLEKKEQYCYDRATKAPTLSGWSFWHSIERFFMKLGWFFM